MDFKQLQTFLAIAECGSATKAAQLLNIVQPAISRQMRLLEEDLGTPLFLRERNGMELTEAGRALLERARRVMRELEEARAEVKPSNGVVSGFVNVGMPSSICDLLAGDLVATIKRRHPQIRMRLHSGYGGPLQLAIQNGELEVAIVNDPKPGPLVETRFVLNEQLFLVGPPRSGLTPEQPQPLTALRGRPMVLPSGPHSMRTTVEHACALENVELVIVAEVNAMDMQKSLVRHGVGWTVLPSAGVSSDLCDGSLSAAPLGGPNLQRHLALCLPTTRRTSAAARCVTSALMDLIQVTVREGRWPGATLVD
ncbi:MAG: LysR family transcriptional regulator [Ramlibacter sp.]|nr:LysR family transcriptional regulator [Ramlibacter sp.]